MGGRVLRGARLLACAVMVLAAAPATAGATSTGDGVWHWQSPLPQGNKLLAVDFVDASIGWAVGQSGSIIHTADGGATWVGQISGTSWNLTDVSFADADNGWAIGRTELTPGTFDMQTSRLLLHTSDGGATWRRQALPGSQWPYLPKDVCFVDAQNGWILGDSGGYDNYILHTTDGGHTWEFQRPESWLPVQGIVFTSPTQGWAVSWTHVYRTDDGGATWQTARDDLGLFPHWSCVTAVGDTVWVGNAESVYWFTPQMVKSTDGGATWTTLSSPPQLLSAPVFVNASEGFGITRSMSQGIVHTADGGATWTSQYTDLWEDPFISNVDPLGLALAAGDALHAMVVGTFGAITATPDGATWNRLSSSLTRDELTDVAFPDALNGWVIARSGAVFHTTDGGAAWQDATPTGLQNPSCIEFVDADHGWISKGHDWDHDSSLLRTTDGGATWEWVPTGPALSSMGVVRLQFFDALHGWALLDYAGIMAHTDDGGTTWQVLDMETTGAGMRNGFDFAFSDPSHGVIVGLPSMSIDGKIVGRTAYTDDGGATWHPDGVDQTAGDGVMLRVVFGDAQHGWVVGSSAIGVSTIWCTEDGGITWQKVDLAAQTPALPAAALAATFRDVAAIDADSAIAVAREGVVLRTDDAGLTWYQQNAGLQRQDSGPYDQQLLAAVCAVDEAHIWAVGGHGTILSTWNGATGPDAIAPVTRVPEADGAWHNDPVITLVPTDGASGVVATVAKVDGGAWRPGDLVRVGAGAHYLLVSSRDAAGNTEDPASAQVKIDLHAPTTQIAARGTWTDQDVDVTLSAADDLSGVAATRWMYYGGLTRRGTSFTVPAPPGGLNDGEHLILYWSEDGAGNIETVNETTVRIDTWSPETTTQDDGALIVGRTAIGLSAGDPAARPDVLTTSGVAATYYSIDGGTYKAATSVQPPSHARTATGLPSMLGEAGQGLSSKAFIDPAADALADGRHTVSFYSVDAAGNAEAPSSISVTVDNSLTTALTGVARTTTNKPTAVWATPAGWTLARIELSASKAVDDVDGAFTTSIAGAGLQASATSFTFTGLAPLHPGTYYLHVRFHSASLSRYGWTPAKALVIPRTATPVLVSPARMTLSSAVQQGRQILKVACALTDRDDSLGSTQIKLTQQRVVNGKVVAQSSKTYTVKSPRAFGSRTHTYHFAWTRPTSLRGKGVYRVIAKARDQEYNWSKDLSASKKTTF